MAGFRCVVALAHTQPADGVHPDHKASVGVAKLSLTLPYPHMMPLPCVSVSSTHPCLTATCMLLLLGCVCRLTPAGDQGTH